VRNSDSGPSGLRRAALQASGARFLLGVRRDAEIETDIGEREDAAAAEDVCEELDESEDAKLGPFVIEGAW